MITIMGRPKEDPHFCVGELLMDFDHSIFWSYSGSILKGDASKDYVYIFVSFTDTRPL